MPTDPAAVNHCTWSDDDVVLNDQVVVRKKMQDGVLQNLHIVANANGAMRVADDLDSGTDDAAFTDHDVTGYLRGRKQSRRSGNGRDDAPVLVELTHRKLLL